MSRSSVVPLTRHAWVMLWSLMVRSTALANTALYLTPRLAMDASLFDQPRPLVSCTSVGLAGVVERTVQRAERLVLGVPRHTVPGRTIGVVHADLGAHHLFDVAAVLRDPHH